jgi:superfamily I DNA and/or RNA helicase
MSHAEAMVSESHPIIAASRRQIEEAREELGTVVLPAEFLDADPRTRTEMLVGTSEALEDARASLFVAAMALHQSFTARAWDPISANLRAWTELITQPETSGPSSSARHLWSTFSLLVPVVSSTFCSFANVFASLGRDAIPWLIVDEAGQAATHHAIDALSRSRRAIVIGDPFQLEPISSVSNAVDDALASRFGIAREFRSKTGSLQTLADRINPFGAKRNGKWIGAPLRVHRRCVEPMFSISNALAYERSMVLANNASDAENPVGNDRLTFGPESAWFNVRGASEMPDKFYVPEEGALACYIMSRLAECRPHQHRGRLPDLFVISPFRKVALGIKQDLLANAPTLFGHIAPDVVEEWAERSIGTVHSFQGKEAEIVLLVLGASDAESISWALAKPNIMNVAVTRARRRLYVIGNRANWFQDSSRDAWMLGQGRDWLVEEADARALFSRTPHPKPHLRLVV